MTQQTKRIVIGISVVGAVLLAGAGAWWLLRPMTPHSDTAQQTPQSTNSSTTNQTNQAPTSSPGAATAQPTGYYGDYTDARAADRSYDTTILFFYAPWCSECRAFEQAIQSGAVPAGVQILKVDYDTRTDLRQKYGVRIQSTFVELDDDDDQDADHDVWVGYGKDKSIDAILRNL